MRDLRELNEYRDTQWEKLIAEKLYGGLPAPMGHEEQAWSGCFVIPSCIDRADLRCVVSCYPPSGWDHVSVSKKKRVPNWYEMDQLHRLFFKPDEYAFQLHVPAGEHISNHDHTLHLWRPMDGAIPLPPSSMVGVKTVSVGTAEEAFQWLAEQRP